MSLKFSFKVKKTSKHAARDVGKRAETVTTTHRGRGQEWRIPKEKPSDIHFPATIRAAAKLQKFRDKPSEVALAIYPEDIREKLRIYRAPMTMVFVLDLSESMLKSLDDVKEAMLKLHSDAYRYRDKVGLVVFKDMGAVVVQHPTSNLRLVTNKLLRLRMSGFTPLAGGMLKALEVLKEAKRRDASAIPVMVIVTDGDANVPLKRDLLTGEIREFDVFDVAFFEYEEQAMKDVFSVSDMIKKEGVHTVVVGMAPKSTDTQSVSTGSIATRMIASITEGVYHEVSGRIVDNWERSDSEISEVILRAQRQISQFH